MQESANRIVKGRFVNLISKKIYPAALHIKEGKIIEINPMETLEENQQGYIIPGFIDSHVHIESSMLIPSEFAKLAVVHGTVGTVSDPHEIANVCGMEGVNYMLANGRKTPFKFNFGAPSCVPATAFETAGANLDSKAIQELLAKEEIRYLSEMMNFPGVLNQDEEVMKKIAAAKAVGKPIDGHAPGLRGEEVKKYIAAGISTDHECFTKEEALDKLAAGMKILIREGSAAKNFEALIPLLDDHYEQMMFCSDDKHPDSLVEGHINQLCARAIAKGHDVFKVLQVASVNPVVHYQLPIGLLSINDPADFIIVKDLTHFEVLATYINGVKVAESGISLLPTIEEGSINQFDCHPIVAKDLRIEKNQYPSNSNGQLLAIEALDGQLITNQHWMEGRTEGDAWVADPEKDCLKMVVVNRYHPAPIAKCFIKNFGLKQGAIASSVAHDSHNIVAVGVSDDCLVNAINAVIQHQGGIACNSKDSEKVLPLPVAGLMSNLDGYQIAAAYTQIDQMAKDLGSQLKAPFMTLSFMALLVIPHLKLSDKGLFDGDHFQFLTT